jgi:hypothetical protein
MASGLRTGVGPTMRRVVGLIACCTALLVCAVAAGTAEAGTRAHGAKPSKSHQKSKPRKHKAEKNARRATPAKKQEAPPHSNRGLRDGHGEPAAEEADEAEEAEEDPTQEESSEQEEA